MNFKKYDRLFFILFLCQDFNKFQCWNPDVVLVLRWCLKLVWNPDIVSIWKQCQDCNIEILLEYWRLNDIETTLSTSQPENNQIPTNFAGWGNSNPWSLCFFCVKGCISHYCLSNVIYVVEKQMSFPSVSDLARRMVWMYWVSTALPSIECIKFWQK